MKKSDKLEPIAVNFEGVSFSYGSVNVLNEVDFHFHKNDFVALVGANGSGKSTILKLLLGLEKPQAGKIEIFGKPISLQYDKLGYVSQNINFDPSFPITVRDVVGLGRLDAASRKFRLADAKLVDDALKKVDIWDLQNRLFSDLSGGQRRRVMVARAIATNPILLVLDEPAANMDAASERRLFETLGALKGNTTILIVTHDSSFVSALTDLVFCVGGRNGDYKVRQHKLELVSDGGHVVYGDNVAKVRHDTSVVGVECCEGEKQG